MTDLAFRRRYAPPQTATLRDVLRATDDIDTRAARIVGLLGLSGDPALIAAHRAVIADVLRVYAAIDAEVGK